MAARPVPTCTAKPFPPVTQQRTMIPSRRGGMWTGGGASRWNTRLIVPELVCSERQPNGLPNSPRRSLGRDDKAAGAISQELCGGGDLRRQATDLVDLFFYPRQNPIIPSRFLLVFNLTFVRITDMLTNDDRSDRLQVQHRIAVKIDLDNLPASVQVTLPKAEITDPTIRLPSENIDYFW